MMMMKIMITWSIFMLQAKSLLSRLSLTRKSIDVQTLISKLLLKLRESCIIKTQTEPHTTQSWVGTKVTWPSTEPHYLNVRNTSQVNDLILELDFRML